MLAWHCGTWRHTRLLHITTRHTTPCLHGAAMWCWYVSSSRCRIMVLRVTVRSMLNGCAVHLRCRHRLLVLLHTCHLSSLCLLQPVLWYLGASCCLRYPPARCRHRHLPPASLNVAQLLSWHPRSHLHWRSSHHYLTRHATSSLYSTWCCLLARDTPGHALPNLPSMRHSLLSSRASRTATTSRIACLLADRRSLLFSLRFLATNQLRWIQRR